MMRFLAPVLILCTLSLGCSTEPDQNTGSSSSSVAEKPTAVEQSSSQSTEENNATAGNSSGTKQYTGWRHAQARQGCDYHVTNLVDSAQVLVDRLRKCDPMGDYFAINGKVRTNRIGSHESEFNTGRTALTNLQLASGKLHYLQEVYNKMPMLARRKAAEELAPIAAEFAVGYLHEDHLQSWLLELSWEEDIEPIDPQWYQGKDWPDNRLQPIQIQGYGEVSKLDLWVRMWWKRRGEALFDAAKDAVQNEYAPRRG